MRLYFIRHGESTANLLREFSNGDAHHPLTEKGLAQAQKVAEMLRARLGNTLPARIYSSPVFRARQTAQIVAARLSAPVEVTEALREWSVGIYEGTANAVGWELHRQVQEDWFDRQNYASRMPGGESFREIEERFVPFVRQLAATPGANTDSYILVGHGGLFLAMLPLVLANVDFAFARQHGVTYTGCVIAETTPGGLICRDWCGTQPPTLS